MGFFGYDKEIKELTENYKIEYEAYKIKCDEIRKEALKHINEYNKHVNVINSEIHNSRNELYSLRKFLSTYGDCGEKITPFDFAGEEMISTDKEEYQSNNINLEKKETSKHKKAAGIVGAFAMLSTPVIGLPVLLGAGIGNKIKSKKEYEKYVESYHQSLIDLEDDICKRELQRDAYETFAEIASLYRATITGIIDSIREIILPELEGIKSFLYADAIKDNILSGYPVDEIKLKKITTFSSTSSPYYSHFLFIQNTVAFYEILKQSFTESTLDKLLEIDDFDYVDIEKDEILDKLDEIKESANKLKEICVF